MCNCECDICYDNCPGDMSKNYNPNKTFVDNLHDYILFNNYISGKDYIEIDLGEYIAFCPFKYEILAHFGDLFHHCVTTFKYHWDDYFKNNFYNWGDLKTFFFRKTDKVNNGDYAYDNIMWEFTCWINIRRCNLLQRSKHYNDIDGDNFYLFHNACNHYDEETINIAKPIIENNYDKIVECFINSEAYKKLNPKLNE